MDKTIYFNTGDIVKIITKKDEEFIGRISHLFHITKENGILDFEFLLSQHPLHIGENYGAVKLSLSYIKSIELIHNYSCLKETNQWGKYLNLPKIKQLIKDEHDEIWEMSDNDVLAMKMKKDKSVISKILNGKVTDIKLSTAIALAKALDVSLDEIIYKNIY